VQFVTVVVTCSAATRTPACGWRPSCTAATPGIGRAVAVLFAREGADIAIGYLSEHEDAGETKHAVEAEGSRCILLPGDVSDPQYAADAVGRTVRSLGKLDLLAQGIRVNCVAPGPVWTPLNPADLDADQTAAFGASVPMKRPAQPEEIAPAFVFLAAAADSSYITGEVLNLFGGKPTP
jgi:NAD(P)-dependent dehydrogenase (short-subunit alcohol dehydrogenase family)